MIEEETVEVEENIPEGETLFSFGEETEVETQEGGEDGAAIDEVLFSFNDDSQDLAVEEEGEGDPEKDELTRKEKLALKDIMYKVENGFKINADELPLLTKAGYEYFVPEAGSDPGKIGKDIEQYLNSVNNNIPSINEVNEEINDIVPGTDYNRLYRERQIDEIQKKGGWGLNTTGAERVFGDGGFDQFGLSSSQDPAKFRQTASGIENIDQVIQPLESMWDQQQHMVNSLDEEGGAEAYQNNYNVTLNPESLHGEVPENREGKFYNLKTNQWETEPAIEATYNKGWNPNKLSIEKLGKVIQQSSSMNMPDKVDDNSFSPLVFKNGVLLSKTKSAFPQADGTPRDLPDLNIIKQLVLSADPYMTMFGLTDEDGVAYGFEYIQKELAKWGLDETQLEEFNAEADDNLLGIFPWGTDVKGNLTEVGKKKMNALIGEYLNQDMFEGVRDLIVKEKGNKLEYDNFNETLDSLPLVGREKALQNKLNFSDNAGLKLSTKPLTFFGKEVTPTAGSPGFNSMFSLNEILDNDKQQLDRKLKARKMQYDQVTNVMEGHLPENWNQWEADALLNNIKNATTENDKNRAMSVYTTWLDENYGGYFTNNMENVKMLYDPKTENFISYKTATPIQKESLGDADEYVIALQKAGEIPTNKNSILEAMLDKQFQMVALAQQIAGEGNVIGEQQSAARGLFEAIASEDTRSNKFSELDGIKEIAKNGVLGRGNYGRIEGLDKIPLVNKWNDLVKDFTTLSTAYTMNYDALTVEKEGFWAGAGRGVSDIVGFDYSSDIDQNKAVASVLQDMGVKFTQAELDTFYTPTTSNNIGYGTPGFIMMAGEFMLTSAGTGYLGLANLSRKLSRVPFMLRNTVKTSKTAGSTKFAEVYTNYAAATIHNVANIAVRNGWTGATYGAEPMSLAFGLFAGPGGQLVDDFYKWRLGWKSAFWNDTKNLLNKVPGYQVVGKGTGGIVTKGVVSTAMLTGGETTVIGTELALGQISKEEAYERLGHLYDGGHLLETFAQVLIVGKMNPIKSMREAYKHAWEDINTLTKGKLYRNKYSKEIGADPNYIFEKGTSNDIQLNRIKESLEKSIEKEGGIELTAFEKLQKAGKNIGLNFDQLVASGKGKEFNLETFNKAWDNIVEQRKTDGKIITAQEQRAANEIKLALEKGLGPQVMITAKLNQASNRLLTQSNMDFLHEVYGDKNDAGIQLLSWVDNFAKRREANLPYNSKDLEVLGMVPVKVLEMVLGENPSVTRSVISDQGSMINNARIGIARRNQLGLKPGSKASNQWLDLFAREIELTRMRDFAKDQLSKGSDLGGGAEANLESLENKIIKNKESQEKVVEKNDVTLEEIRQENIIKAKQDGPLDVSENTTEFLEKLDAQGKTEGIVSQGTKTQQVALDLIDNKIAEYKKDNSPEAKELLAKAEKQRIDILETILEQEGTKIKGISLEVDGKNVSYINLQAMRELKDVTAMFHEHLHPWANTVLKGKTQAEQQAFIVDFKEQLTPFEYETVLRKVQVHPDFKKGQNPNTLEWINLYADALIKGELGYKKSSLEKLGKLFEKRMKVEAPNVEIKTAEQVYDFITNVIYPNIQKGKSTEGVAKAMLDPVTEANSGAPALSAEGTKVLEKDLVSMKNTKATSVENLLEAKSLFETGKMDIKDYERIKTEHNKLMSQLNPKIQNITDNLRISDANEVNIEVVKKGYSFKDKKKPTKEERIQKDEYDKAYQKLLKDNEGIIGPVLNLWKDKGSKVEKADWEATVYEEIATKLIPNFNESLGVPFGAYLKQRLALREGNMWKRLLEKGHDFFTEDINAATFTEVTSNIGEIDLEQRGEIVRSGGGRIGKVIAEELGVDYETVKNYDNVIKDALINMKGPINLKTIGGTMVEVNGKQVKLKDYIAEEIDFAFGENAAEQLAFIHGTWRHVKSLSS